MEYLYSQQVEKFVLQRATVPLAKSKAPLGFILRLAFQYHPQDFGGGVKELRLIEQPLVGCLQNLRFVDIHQRGRPFADLRLIFSLKTSSTNQSLYIALFTEF